MRHQQSNSKNIFYSVLYNLGVVVFMGEEGRFYIIHSFSNRLVTLSLYLKNTKKEILIEALTIFIVMTISLV